MGSRPENSTEKEEDDKNDNGELLGAVVAVTAVAGVAALAVWGLSKLFGSSKPEENNMMMASSSSTVSRDWYKLEGIDDNKWTKPEYGWYKLNTDASVFPNTDKPAVAGGLIRDYMGRWIVGFTASLDPCNITSAELQAVREGLKLAWKRGLKKVKIETDSEAAVILIKNPEVNSENHSLGCIIEECRNLMKRNWSIELNHICRAKNRCANAMAKMGKDQIKPLIIWNEAPGNFQTLLSADMYD